ncbi:hypothetical protein [Cohnella panacarvi]|uniref:hypothetical protein n=1 Tax=Cohnella panacarvi TaxID=400776 RepID=UPI00047ABFBD|nr:hypothetical protein [Cohnella panacarvi]
MGLNEYLENLVTTVHYPITFGATEPATLSRWMVKAVTIPNAGPWGTKPYLGEDGRTIYVYETSTLPVEKLEQNWRHYNSDLIEVHQDPNKPGKMFNPEPDKWLYAVCNVYAMEDSEALIKILTYMPSPIRLWINGELVIAGNEDFVVKDLLARVRFKAGNNVVLAELPLRLRVSLTTQEFIVKLQPLRRLRSESANYEFIDPELIDTLERSAWIAPERVNVKGGEQLRLIVLSSYLRGEGGQPVLVRLESADGRTLATVRTESGQATTLPIPEAASGTLRIVAEGSEDGAGVRCKPVHLLCGDFAEERDSLLRQAAGRQDLREDIISSMRQMMELPQSFQEVNQLVPYEVYDSLLERMAEFRASMNAPERLYLRTYSEVFKARYAVYRLKDTKDASIAYVVNLPEHYDPDRKYPLVVYFHDAQGRNFPSDLPWTKRFSFTEAIIVQMVGIGRLNYTDDIGVIRTIGEIVQELNADRDRIYGIGFCTGAMKAYRLGFIAPDLFAGIATIIGDARIDANEPQYEWFDNLGNTTVYGLCSDENWFFNSARKINLLQRMKKSHIKLYAGFFHNEFNTLHNSRTLMRRLVATDKERYPREIDFMVLEPCFSKSHWLRVKRIVDLKERANVKARILSRQEVEIRADNVSELELLLSPEEMGLDSEITLLVNGRRASARLSRYSRATLSIGDAAASLSVSNLSKEAFIAAYDAIGVDETQLGIKRLYTGPCTVVKPSGRSPFTTKLSYLLQNPIRDRYIYYKYESCRESELNLEHTSESNYIFIVDARSPSVQQQRLLEAIGLKLEPERLTWKGQSYEGDYYAFIACPNPWFADRRVMVAVYNSDKLDGEIVGLMNSFDRNPLFYYDAIVYHHGRIQGLRHEAEKSESLGGVV